MGTLTHRTTSLAFVFIGLLLALWTLPALVLAQATDAVEVTDQPVQGGSVTVDRVVAAQAGWITIHADDGGNPGPVLGQTAVNQGENSNVQVSVGTEVRDNARLHAMLHIDAGTAGTYEFPGADAPVQRPDGTIVNVPFTVQAAQQSPTASPAASPAASPPAIALPNSGATGWLALPVLLGIAVVFLVAGVTLRARQQRTK